MDQAACQDEERQGALQRPTASPTLRTGDGGTLAEGKAIDHGIRMAECMAPAQGWRQLNGRATSAPLAWIGLPGVVCLLEPPLMAIPTCVTVAVDVNAGPWPT